MYHVWARVAMRRLSRGYTYVKNKRTFALDKCSYRRVYFLYTNIGIVPVSVPVNLLVLEQVFYSNNRIMSHRCARDEYRETCGSECGNCGKWDNGCAN